jgi:hypothetical protein
LHPRSFGTYWRLLAEFTRKELPKSRLHWSLDARPMLTDDPRPINPFQE